jgi:hypothetical protein
VILAIFNTVGRFVVEHKQNLSNRMDFSFAAKQVATSWSHP